MIRLRGRNGLIGAACAIAPVVVVVLYFADRMPVTGELLVVPVTLGASF